MEVRIMTGMIILLAIVVFVLAVCLAITVLLLRSLERRVDGLTEMGSVHWEVEALAKRIEDHNNRLGLPPIEWNRDKNGMITGIVHDVEIHFQAENQLGV